MAIILILLTDNLNSYEMLKTKSLKYLVPRTREEIAQHIGFSVRTLRRKMKAANLNIQRGLVSPEDQVKIYTLLGYASKLELSEE